MSHLLPSRSKNAYFESYKISAKPREIKACGILQSGRFMSEKGVNEGNTTRHESDASRLLPVPDSRANELYPDLFRRPSPHVLARRDKPLPARQPGVLFLGMVANKGSYRL
jgi:hypothetical protein